MKKIKFFSVIGIFVLSFINHFIYDLFPNDLFAIFFLVNESIWEHMKIIITSILLYSPIEYFFINRKQIPVHNFLFSNLIMCISGISFYLIIFLPIYSWIGENRIITISLLFLTYIIVEIIGYYILNKKSIHYQTILSTIGIILLYLLFGYLTYRPIRNFIFYDIKEKRYGINIYQI